MAFSSFGESHEQKLWLFREEPEKGIRGSQHVQPVPPERPLFSFRIIGLAHAIDCILDNQSPIPSGEHARHCIDVIEKIRTASRTGATQPVVTIF